MSQNANNEPPSQVSDEADQNQLEMARAEGTAYQRSLDYMVNEVADTGGKQRAGDYIIGFAQDRAEGMYMLNDGGSSSGWSPKTGTATWRSRSATPLMAASSRT